MSGSAQNTKAMEILTSEISNDVRKIAECVFYDRENEKILIVRYLTDQELDGFYEYCEPDFFTVKDADGDEFTYVTNQTFSTKEFKNILKKIKFIN